MGMSQPYQPTPSIQSPRNGRLGLSFSFAKGDFSLVMTQMPLAVTVLYCTVLYCTVVVSIMENATSPNLCPVALDLVYQYLLMKGRPVYRGH